MQEGCRSRWERTALQWRGKKAVESSVPGTMLLCRREKEGKTSHQRGTNKLHSRTWILFRQEVTHDRPVAFPAWMAIECPLGRRSKPVERGSLLNVLTGTTPDSVYSKSTPLGAGYLYHRANKSMNYSICKSKDKLHQDAGAAQNLKIPWIDAKNWVDLKVVSYKHFHS